MKHNLTKLFTLLILAAMSMGAMANTVEDLVAIDCDYVFIADDVTSNGTVGLTANTLYDEGHIFAPTANTVAANKGSNTFAGSSHLNSLRLKNTQDRLSFKVSAPCTITFYTQSHDSRGIYVGKTDNVSTDEAAYAKQPASTPVWEVELDEAGVYYLSNYNGDFYFAGFEVVFPDDPAAVEFGFTRTVAAETSTSSDALVSDKYRVSDDIIVDPSVEGVTFSKNFGLQSIMTDKSRSTHWYNGTADQECYVDKLDKNYRTQFEIGVVPESAEAVISVTSLDERCYYGFDLTIAEGYKLSIVRIISDVLKDANNTHYQIKVYNNSSLIKTLEDVAVTNYTTSEMKRSVRVACDEDLQDLTGTVSVKMFFWNTGSTKYMVLKDFKVKAVVHSITSQTKTLKAIEVNGVDYDFENEGNTIDALLHAAPSVKFYYDVKNNWSDGSQTAAPDEDETIVASESAGNYVATTTLLATPYSLTFTNIDLPKTFGMGREFEDATHFESGVEKLMGTAPAHVTVALHNGAGLDHTDGNKDLCHGTTATVATPTAYRNHCYATDALANAVFLDNFYWGFSVDVAVGYSMSISQIYGDMYAQKNKIQYKMGVYTSDADDAEPLYMSEIKEGTITTMGSENVPMTVNTSEVAALQGLTGKIYFRFYWNIESTAANAALKDFNITAAVDPVEGEGVADGLSFVDFTPAKNPTFTDGDVTVVWSNGNNNIGPQSGNRGIRMQNGYGDFKVRVSVPSDSYISEVVFVWNHNGNQNEAGDCVNLTVKDNSETIIGTVTDKKPNTEVAWTCGSIRESELTFTQGDGDFYCNSMRVTYLRKVAKSYTRTHKHMNLNTLCYPYQIDSYTGATFYTMLRKEVDGVGNPTDVYLQEHVGALEAGKPYFYVPEGSELVCYYSGAYTAAEKVNGVQGCYADNTAVPVNSYVTYNNIIQNIGSNSQVTLGEYRAYIVMNEVAGDAVAAPGRRILRVGNGHNSATGIETVEERALMRNQKVIRDGQLFIIRDGKMYNAQGQRVK